jgi:acyl-CoA synthetase (NDP forming)/GNAT superfamily N-acetyltransferase
VVLTDGATVHVRPIAPVDGPAIQALHSRLSDETIYYRFFSPLPHLSDALLDRLVHVDYDRRFALIAELGNYIVAVARYERLPPQPDHPADAEVAFLVEDSHQGRGLGTILLEHMAAVAKEAGVQRFVAETLPDNARMLSVFHEAGFEDEQAFAQGVVRVVFPIEPTLRSTETQYGRERQATAASIRRLLFPRTVAVVGASERHPSFGGVFLRRLLDGGFRGAVYPVHPHATHLASVRAWPRVTDIPDRVELAVVLTPAAAVPSVVEDCARAGVGGLVIVSAGFAEQDDAGAAAERALVAAARRNGMRVIGPGSLGLVNTDPNIRLNATLSPMPPAGPLGFTAQSGGLGVVVLDEVRRRGLGLSTFVSAGNKADVSGNDLLQYWDDDPATRIIGMYIESFGNPRVFSRVARQVSRRKPIVAVASKTAGVARLTGRPPPDGPHVPEDEGRGRVVGGQGGGRARVVGGQDQRREAPATAVDALFRQSGVICTNTLEELLDVIQVLESQPMPRGRRMAVVGNVGGPSVVAADACADAGLELPVLSSRTREALAKVALAGPAPDRNPVSLAAGAPPEHFGVAVRAVLDDDAVDACLAVCSVPLHQLADEVAAELVAAATDRQHVPLLACLVGRRGLIGEPGATRVPSFAFPEPAVRALSRLATYADWLRRPAGKALPLGDLDPGAAAAVVDEALGNRPEGGWLSGAQTVAVLGAYGITVAPIRWVATADAAVEAAEVLGYPVVVKPDNGPDGPHARRSEVYLGLGSPAAVRHAAHALGRPVIVQRMMEAELDVVAGLVADPVFGPLVTLGPPRALSAPPPPPSASTLPLTDLDAAELLDGVVPAHGSLAPAGRRSLRGLLGRLARMGEDLPDVAEVELDPVLVSDRQATVTDARVRVAPDQPHPELALRRLS